MRALQTLVATLCLLIGGTVMAQKAQTTPKSVDISQRNTHEVPSQETPMVRIAVGGGLMPTVFSSGGRAYGVLAARAQVRISQRASVGLAFAQGNTESSPYQHQDGTVSVRHTQLQNIGLRLQATAVKSGRFEFYGGVQLGITRPKERIAYTLPADIDVPDEAAYFASLPSPYAPPRTQPGAAGFLGLQVEVLKHVHVYGEVGSSLAMLQTGLEIAF